MEASDDCSSLTLEVVAVSGCILAVKKVRSKLGGQTAGVAAWQQFHPEVLPTVFFCRGVSAYATCDVCVDIGSASLDCEIRWVEDGRCTQSNASG